MKRVIIFVLMLSLSFSALYCQQVQSTTSPIDQALEQLTLIEQNNNDLKALLNEREATINEKQKSLDQMTQQFSSLEISYSLSKNKNKILTWTLIGVSSIAVIEGIVLTSR